MVKFIKLFFWLVLVSCSFFSFGSYADCPSKTQKLYQETFKIETNNLIIVPVTSVDEFKKLIQYSQDDKYAGIYTVLSQQYGFPSIKNLNWETKIKEILSHEKFCAKTTLPFLFAAYKRDSNSLIGFYMFLPSQKEPFSIRLEQRTLLTKEARSGGIGTELRKAMINFFKTRLLGNKFEVMFPQSSRMSYVDGKVTSFISGVEAGNFASLISNIRACLPITTADETFIFRIPGIPFSSEKVREGYCVILNNSMDFYGVPSDELLKLVCEKNRPLIQLNPHDKANSPNNIAFSINKVIDEVEKQQNLCK